MINLSIMPRRAVSIAGVLLMLFTTLTPAVAQALDVNFFSNNDILFYNPESCSITNQSGNIAIAGNDVAEQVYNFLTSTKFASLGNQPFNAIQAAGALGNFQWESTMRPSAIENNKEDSAVGDGHGLAQWSYSVSGGVRVGPGRRGALMDLAKQQSKPWSDISVQLQLIKNELDGSYGASLLKAGFASAADPGSASEIFTTVYEGPNESVANRATRDKNSQAYYQEFKDKTPKATVTSPSGTTSTCASSGGTGTASGNFATDFTFYNQCASPWGQQKPPANTVCYNACGPTSTAMAVKNMTGQNITPQDTVDYVTQHGLWLPAGGTSFDTNIEMAKNWGLSNSRYLPEMDAQNLDKIRQILDQGNLVMVAGYGPFPYYGSAGHFIIIRSITSDGKVLIANPAPHVNSTNDTSNNDNVKAWDAGDIINSNVYGGVVFAK